MSLYNMAKVYFSQKFNLINGDIVRITDLRTFKYIFFTDNEFLEFSITLEGGMRY